MTTRATGSALLCLAAFALTSCMGTAGSAGASARGNESSTAADEPTPTEATPEPTVTEQTFVDGPAIAPASELATWLSQNKGNLLRLPLVIEVESYEVGPAWIGMTKADAPADAVLVQLDQGRLSRGLTDRLVPLCDQTPTRCVAWIEGYWGPTVSLPGPPGFDGPSVPGFPKKEPFSIVGVVGLVKEGDTPHVKVVKD